MKPANPFRVAELVRGAYFTDREDEVRTVERAMRERGQGPRPRARICQYS